MAPLQGLHQCTVVRLDKGAVQAVHTDAHQWLALGGRRRSPGQPVEDMPARGLLVGEGYRVLQVEDDAVRARPQALVEPLGRMAGCEQEYASVCQIHGLAQGDGGAGF